MADLSAYPDHRYTYKISPGVIGGDVGMPDTLADIERRRDGRPLLEIVPKADLDALRRLVRAADRWNHPRNSFTAEEAETVERELVGAFNALPPAFLATIPKEGTF